MSNQWKPIKLGEILTPVARVEAIDPTKEYRLLGIRLDGGGPFLRETVLGSQTAATKLFQVKSGDFIYSRLFAWRAAFGVIRHDLDRCYVSGEFPTFEAVPGKIDSEFLRLWFRLPSIIKRVEADCTGSTPLTRNRFKENFFLDLEIPLPSLSEQQRIVARIEELTAKIAEARSLRQQARAEMEAILSAEVSNIDIKLRSSSPVTELQRLALDEKGSLRSGPFGSALLHSEFVSNGIPAIGIQDVQENRFVLTRHWNVTPEKAMVLKRYTIRPRDILVTVMGTLGRACVVPVDAPRMVSTKHVWTITLDQSKSEPRWVSYWLNFSRAVREELLGQGTGTAIPGLNGQKIRATILPEISVQKQQGIVAYLDNLQTKLDALKKLQAETAAELDALLPSILDKAFKGEL